jgi:hypothetical protein
LTSKIIPIEIEIEKVNNSWSKTDGREKRERTKWRAKQRAASSEQGMAKQGMAEQWAAAV